ncbi:MAG TPA: hypothetical protein VFZ75_08135, partial [Actinomycetota bacterium]|nr:hypothetical protein [Actinomycetota bacterium]
MRPVLLAALVVALLPSSAAFAQTAGGCEVLVVTIGGASLPDLLAAPELRSLAAAGGAALMNGRADAVDELRGVADRAGADTGLCLVEMDPGAGPADAARVLASGVAEAPEEDVLVLVLSASASAASAAEGDELGTAILARGDLATLLETSGEPRALTSDSSRRAGVVAD